MSWANTWTGGPRLGDKPQKPTHFLDETIGQWKSLKTGKLSKPKCVKHASDNCPVLCKILESR